MEPSKSAQSVAVIGSGLAGLVTAYVLARDPQKRYDVEILESQACLSLDSASVDVSAYSEEGDPQRIDVPMRAFSDGFYPNLLRLYKYLGIPFRKQYFNFCFSKLSSSDCVPEPYMVHSSGFHQLPPPRPKGVSLLKWLCEALYVAVCYAWFAFCCHVVRPRTQRDSATGAETFRQYLQRNWVPAFFSRKYIVPLMSSVSTCSHEELLDFPATDLVTYVREIGNRNHFRVSTGVKMVQEKLAKDIRIHLKSRVNSIVSDGNRVLVQWDQTDENGTITSTEKVYDQVILGVSPNVVGNIFEPLKKDMQQVPTTAVDSVVHTIPKASEGMKLKLDDLHLNSSDEITESVHVATKSVVVTTHPILPIQQSTVISRTTLIRTLRNLRSQNVLNRIFNGERTDADLSKAWHNGDGNVWLVGGWCWDGMVLLEGCVVSAMRVATALGVPIPWMHDNTAAPERL